LNNSENHYNGWQSEAKDRPEKWVTLDMGFGPHQIGRWLILAGIVIALSGALVMLLGRLGLFRLPGDLEFGGRDWRLYVPIASCILISIVLTLILWLISYFRR
jgi:predicted Co/Zn/Cd cation transporter (cation efflux family)